jgi:hypothetical protein
MIHIPLLTGDLRLNIDEQDAGLLDDYCTFAARDNARRGFLFVSKVLGKHYPARPAAMRHAHEALASMVVLHEHEHAAVVGMAETATGLGYGVFEALLRANSKRSAVYGHTTRYWMHEDVLTFEESHSHAPSLCLHSPQFSDHASIQERANVLILVDDELSTGMTFSNLVLAYKARYPSIERIHVATLTDFSDGRAQATIAARTGMPVSVGAIVSGGHEFLERGSANRAPELQAQPRQFRRSDLPSEFGRGWTGAPLEIDSEYVQIVANGLRSTTGPILVLGTGEFMHAAYVLAIKLEGLGFTTRVQSTTRSPILIGNGIASKLTVSDPYLENVPNYLYNVVREHYSEVLVCHEATGNDATAALARQLDGLCVHFNYQEGRYALSLC